MVFDVIKRNCEIKWKPWIAGEHIGGCQSAGGCRERAAGQGVGGPASRSFKPIDRWL